MGLRYRKSVNMGPLRFNFSKSGIGYSVGGKGFRWTKKANGGTRTTASIPGTGISYVKETGRRNGVNPSRAGGGRSILLDISRLDDKALFEYANDYFSYAKSVMSPNMPAKDGVEISENVKILKAEINARASKIKKMQRMHAKLRWVWLVLCVVYAALVVLSFGVGWFLLGVIMGVLLVGCGMMYFVSADKAREIEDIEKNEEP